MRRAVLAILLVCNSAWAGRVMVLPIDGAVDADQKKQLGAAVVAVTRDAGGDVTTGDTTFAETAAAVGCDPHAQACADTVLATLGVDEIVYGTATDGGNHTTVMIVSRVAKGQPRRDQTLALAATDAPSSASDRLHPLFDLPVVEDKPVIAEKPQPKPVDESFFATRERKLGVAFIGGGALVLIIGLALWSSESSVQAQINNAPTDTAQNIADLLVLEDRASSYAWQGNVAVVLGLAAAGVGTWYLVKDHQLRATVAPVDHGAGAAVTIGGHW